ncbi:MAG: glycosyltransferase family 39 protein [Pseudomonadota bacterium]
MRSSSNIADSRLSPVLPWVLLVLIGILIVRAFVLYLTPTQLFFDEAQYWSWGLVPDFGYFSKPPLLAWIIRGFTEVCGNAEACIRLASPVLYTITALLCGLLAARVTARMGGSAGAALFWCAVLFATLPGVTFATRLISTDAPLLACFAAALYFLDRLRERATIFDAVAMGAAVGLGLMAKYAMIYFVLCLLLWGLFTREGRATLCRVQTWLFLPVAALIVAPNIWWNAENGWITFQHTQDNANWQGFTLHFGKMAEFFGAQIGILGPVLFIVLVIGLWSSRKALSDDVRFLLFFSLPVTGLMMAQALISRAHANWAAVSFIALTALTVSWLVTWRAKPLLIIALVVQLAVFGVLSGADVRADRLVQQPIGYSYKRLFGWRELAGEVTAVARAHGAKTILADRRAPVAQLLYHLHGSPFQLRTWPADGRPGNHYEMAMPLSRADPGPVLLLLSCRVTAKGNALKVLPTISVPVRPGFAIGLHPVISANPSVTKADVC